jgi:hypothetical protein
MFQDRLFQVTYAALKEMIGRRKNRQLDRATPKG